MTAETFGPYLIYEELGAGGMATVHRAETRGIAGFRKVVALKRMLPWIAEEDELVESFVREARLAAQLNHPHIAQTYSLGKAGDIYYIAMELVVGHTLKRIQRATNGPLPISVTLSILDQVLDALAYAHELRDRDGTPLGIIHRDVTPSNIMLDETGIVKLIDFGIAKVTTEGQRTQAGVVKGKFSYIAPEYIAGGAIDARADLFAVGVLAHELLTGKLLFKADNDFDTLKNVRDMPVEPPSRTHPRIPGALDKVIMKALERDRASRWQSARQFRSALAGIKGFAVTHREIADWIRTTLPKRPPTDTTVAERPAVQLRRLAKAPHVVTPTDEENETLPPFHGTPDYPTQATTNVVVELWKRKRSVSPWLVVLLLIAIAGAAAYYVSAGVIDFG